MNFAECVLSVCAAVLAGIRIRNEVLIRRRRRQLDGEQSSDPLPSRGFTTSVLKRPEVVEKLRGCTQKEINDFIVAEILPCFPRHFEVFGHVAIVKAPESTPKNFFTYIPHFAVAFSRPPQRVVDHVLLEEGGVTGELRIPAMRLLWMAPGGSTAPQKLVEHVAQRVRSDTAASFRSFSDCPTFTMHIENGVRYAFDPMRVMFCSGNITERMHFGTSIDALNETVVDMFAGIGYFTLPLAARAKPLRIFAIEKNPHSASFLRFNCYLNGVEDVVTVIEGDNRDVDPQILQPHSSDRVIMGYINPSLHTKTFLPSALQLLKCDPDGAPCGVIHYHFLSNRKNSARAVSVAREEVEEMLGPGIAHNVLIPRLRVVKSYAPRKWHCVVDLVFYPAPSPKR